MFELLRTISGYSVPVFVVATMLNVGLTQRLGAILEHLSNRPFMLKMLAANFIGAPLLMVGALKLVPFDPELKVGLLIFSLCAGAPFLIKLTQASKNEVALGAAVMMMLMLATTMYVPVVFPMLLDTLTVGAWDIASALALQMILPTAIGMLMAQFASRFAGTVQPWIGRLSNVALAVVLVTTLTGYAPAIGRIAGEGAILLAALFVLAAVGLGWLAGWGRDILEDVGALGTAQRNTAAGLIIAGQNFPSYPNVLVMIVLANTLGILMLLVIATRMRRDNPVLPAFGECPEE
jgi:BASS family bile acid:Na+ symporter